MHCQTIISLRLNITRFIALLLLCLATMPLTGCQTTSQGSNASYAERANHLTGSQLGIFLNLKTPSGPAIRMTVSSIEILAETEWLPLTVQNREVDAGQIGAGQLFLGRSVIPPGRYQSLRIVLDSASLRRDNDKYVFLALDSPTIELELPAPLVLDKGDSRSLFITWDANNSQVGAALLRPSMTIAPQLKHLLADLAYVACPDINTLYVIRTDKNWVYDSIGIPGEPTYPVTDPTTGQRLYVLASADSAIKVIDLSANRIVNSFRIPLTVEPSFMALSPDGQWAYVLDERGSNILRMDLSTGTLATRVRLGFRPQYATYIADQNLLAVSSSLSQAVYLLDPLSLEQVDSIFTGNSPQGMLATDGLLYIAETAANTVTIYDLESRRIRTRLTVGFSPRRLLDSGNHIYVSNYRSGSVSVLLPGQLGVAKEIKVASRPLEMICAQNNRWLYIADEALGGLVVIDPTTNRVANRIEFGARPLGLAVIE